MQQVSLYFNKKLPGKRVSKNITQLVYFNYYKGKSAKEIAVLLKILLKVLLKNQNYIRGLPFIFRNLATIVLQSAN